MQPLQPCLMAGCGNWARVKRRRRKRVKARPKTGRRKDPGPQPRPRELRRPVIEHRRAGAEPLAQAPWEQAPSGPQSEALQQDLVDGRGPRSFHLPRGEGLPSSLPCLLSLLSLLLLEIPLEKVSMVFLPEKKCLGTWARRPSSGSNSAPRLPPWWLESPSRPACSCQAADLACLLCFRHPGPEDRGRCPMPWTSVMQHQCLPDHTETSFILLPPPGSHSTHVTRPVTHRCTEPKARSRAHCVQCDAWGSQQPPGPLPQKPSLALQRGRRELEVPRGAPLVSGPDVAPGLPDLLSGGHMVQSLQRLRPNQKPQTQRRPQLL